MKRFQDAQTGKIYAFEDDIDPLKLNNRNIPEMLSKKVIEKPSDLHIWCKGDWILEKDKPDNYEEPISDIPVYNPAWITFLFHSGTVLFNEKNKFEISLEQINTNTYQGKELSKIITTLSKSNADENYILPILVSTDGSVSIPVNDSCNTQEIAVSKMNEIIGALFLGGILVKTIDILNLQQGTLLEGGGYNFSYIPSRYNRFRNNWASISELSVFLNPDYIHIENIEKAYIEGIDFMSSMTFSPMFLVQGYHSMQFWKTADALSNLWIVVEQLTDKIFKNISEEVRSKIFNELNIKQAEKINMKHKVLKQGNIISFTCFNILDETRLVRNDLLHEGKVPKHSIVEKLWIVLFEMFELASEKKLDNLYKATVNQQTQKLIRFHSNYFDKSINPKKTNFDEWAQYDK